MSPNTSIERVNVLMQHSDRLYDRIDHIEKGEARYRRILRLGINVTARSLREGRSLTETGGILMSLPYDGPLQPGPLDTLANQYADVTRATVDRYGAPETDARHAVHLMHLAAPYAREYYPRLDAQKIAAYALLHDIVEAFSGDIPSLGMTAEQETQKNLDEAAAISLLKRQYAAAWPELVETIEQYETLTDPESRFTKTFDKLDPGFTHFYSHGSQLKTHYGFNRDEFLQAVDATTVRMTSYGSEFPLVMQDRNELTRRVTDITYPKAA